MLRMMSDRAMTPTGTWRSQTYTRWERVATSLPIAFSSVASGETAKTGDVSCDGPCSIAIAQTVVRAAYLHRNRRPQQFRLVFASATMQIGEHVRVEQVLIGDIREAHRKS